MHVFEAQMKELLNRNQFRGEGGFNVQGQYKVKNFDNCMLSQQFLSEVVTSFLLPLPTDKHERKSSHVGQDSQPMG